VTDIHESAGSYALHALDQGELTEFEAHLATCETCQDEVAELCETAVELSLLALATPPPGLRDRVMAEIQNTPQLPAEDSTEAPAHPVANGSRPAPESLRAVRSNGPRRALPGTEVPDEPEQTQLQPRPQPVDELAQRRQRRRSRLLTGLVAAMLALAVGLGGVVFSLVQERQAQVASISLEQELYAAPDVTFTETDLKGGGKATFVFSEQLNRAQFIGTDLPDPGRDKRYQLWTMNGPEPKWVEATSITRDTQITDRASAVKVFFRGDIAAADWLCVSLEPKDNLTDKPTVPPAGSAEV
jgi:anti-sigma factor RsiW